MRRETFASIINDLPVAFRLARALATRDISATYRQSMLGYVWAFLPALGTSAVFLFLRAGGAFKTEDSAIPYPVFVLIGTLLWQVFADSVAGPLKSVSNNKAMLVKIRFPQEAIILSAVLVTLFNFAVRLFILVPALVWFSYQGQYSFHVSSLVLFPIGVAGLIALGYAIGILLTPAGMFFNDISLGIQTVLTFWMLISPVVMVPPASGASEMLLRLNPVSGVLNFARNAIVGLGCDWSSFATTSAVSFACIVAGCIIYRIALPHTIARMGM